MLLVLNSERLDAGPSFMDSDIGLVHGLAFSPDDGQIAFSNDGAIEIRDIAKAILVNRLEESTLADATRVSYSADGKRLYAITSSYREPEALTWNVNGAQIWDVSSGQLLKQFDLPIENQVGDATALNGPLFARNSSNDHDSHWIELWNLESGEMLTLPMPEWDADLLRFSPDGSLLLAISDSNLFLPGCGQSGSDCLHDRNAGQHTQTNCQHAHTKYRQRSTPIPISPFVPLWFAG